MTLSSVRRLVADQMDAIEAITKKVADDKNFALERIQAKRETIVGAVVLLQETLEELFRELAQDVTTAADFQIEELNRHLGHAPLPPAAIPAPLQSMFEDLPPDVDQTPAHLEPDF